MSEKPPIEGLRILQDAALISLGFLLGKEGVRAAPVLFLAKGLKDSGCACDYVDAILEANEVKRDGAEVKRDV